MGIASGTRLVREPTTGKQYFPGAGYQPGTAEKEATDGRTRLVQEKKPELWNGYEILYLCLWRFAVVIM